MSIASEIRDALTKTPDLTAGELMEACPSAENSTQVSTALVNMIERKEVTRTGDRGAYQHRLNPDYTPKRSSDAAPPPKTTKAAKKAKAGKTPAPKKSQRPAAKSQRKTAVSRPAKPTANAIQVGGSHYQALAPQPWDVITSWGLSFLAGNVIKYVARAPAKGGIEDLQKARHYLDKLIETTA